MNILTRVLFLILFVSLITPFLAEASVFSSIINFFSGSKAEAAQEDTQNSQTMALAVASISPNPDQSSTTSDISIVSGTSILPESQGPFSDGKDHTNQSDQISLYVVRKGDTLPAIAKMFGVTTNTIVWANDLQGKSISVGQTLVIMPISGITHTVVRGDTLKGIANKYKGDINDILQYNNLSMDSKLAVGDTIFIPDGEASVSPAPSGNGGGNNNGNGGGQTSGGTSGAGSIRVNSYCQNYPEVVGYYMRPVVNCIKTQGIHGHNAVDLASAYGSNIMASANGTVIIARTSGWNGGYGEYVAISHPNGTQTVYGHMSAVDVSVGDTVTQGQIIGRVGSTGNSTGPHVHFEVRGARNPF